MIDMIRKPIVGRFTQGTLNSITDVSGVRVGHCTLNQNSDNHSIRTGVTAIIPNDSFGYSNSLPASVHVINGAGELTGAHQINEWGFLETPILLTNTLSVGTCMSAMTEYLCKKFSNLGLTDDVIIPVVGECDDSWLNDIRQLSITKENVWEALDTASSESSGKIAQGSVGAGTGMISFDFKAGIGTASRNVNQHTIGSLVLNNFGNRENLRILNQDVGTALKNIGLESKRTKTAGSIIIVLATDAPLLPNQLNRIAKRASFGIGRVGGFGAHGSGEISIAFSTANQKARGTQKTEWNCISDTELDLLFEATVDIVEESILNSLFYSQTTTGLQGRVIPGLADFK